ncbi:unnamed protein product [Lactuca saligna]|uniref:PUA domain-containing protein n=1 Tax=Lactuca saligna TaxID=75948 RepID=A0AA36A512_LACSI|nr:unnamed protein product [Lactuca saligna]
MYLRLFRESRSKEYNSSTCIHNPFNSDIISISASDVMFLSLPFIVKSQDRMCCRILEIQCDKRLQDTIKNGDIESLSVLKSQIPGLDYVVFVKGSGPHDIQYDYQQDRPPKEIIVICKCAEAVLRGAQVYVPGILAHNAHVEKGDLVAVSVGVEQPSRDNGWAIGITCGIVLQELKTDPQYLARDGLYISQGTTTMSRAGKFHGLLGLAVDMTYRVFKLTSFNGGHISSKPVKHHHCTCLRSTRGRKNIGHVCCPWWKNNCNCFPYER